MVYTVTMGERVMRLHRQIMNKPIIKFSDDPKRRNTSVVMTCDQCAVPFHPRKGAHLPSTKYCSPECARKAVNGNRRRG